MILGENNKRKSSPNSNSEMLELARLKNNNGGKGG
jgi:hypothetical protein